MKEITVINTVQFTRIVKVENYAVTPKEQVEKLLDQVVQADDIKVISQQTFIRDLPNTSEVVVGVDN